MKFRAIHTRTSIPHQNWLPAPSGRAWAAQSPTVQAPSQGSARRANTATVWRPWDRSPSTSSLPTGQRALGMHRVAVTRRAGGGELLSLPGFSQRHRNPRIRANAQNTPKPTPGQVTPFHPTPRSAGAQRMAPPRARTQTSHQESWRNGIYCPRANATQAMASVTYFLRSLAVMQRTETNTEKSAVAEEAPPRGRSYGRSRINTNSRDPLSHLTGEDSEVQKTKTLVSKIAPPLSGRAKAWPRVCLPRSAGAGSDPARARTPLGGQETGSLWL